MKKPTPNVSKLPTLDTWNRERSAKQLANFVTRRWNAAGLDENEL